MNRATPYRLLAVLLVSGCVGSGTRPDHALDSYGATVAGDAVDPVPSYFAIRELRNRWWFIAPSGRRFLAVSGATTPESGKPASADPAVPRPYFTAGLAGDPGARPVPMALPGLPDPWHEATLPGLTDAAMPPAVFGDDPFCLGHLAIPGADLMHVPDALTAGTPAATAWFELRTKGATPAAFRAEYADRLLRLMTSALRGADDHHLIFTGWYDPGTTEPGVAQALGRWGDAVCVRIPAGPDAVRMAQDAHAAVRKPLIVWLTDPAGSAALGTACLDLLALPYVVGVDTPLPPTATEAYRRHAGGR